MQILEAKLVAFEHLAPADQTGRAVLYKRAAGREKRRRLLLHDHMLQVLEEFRIEVQASSHAVARPVMQEAKSGSEGVQKHSDWQLVVAQAELVAVSGIVEVESAAVATYGVPTLVQLASYAPLL